MDNDDDKAFVPNANRKSVKNNFANVKQPIQNASCIIKEQLNAVAM